MIVETNSILIIRTMEKYFAYRNEVWDKIAKTLSVNDNSNDTSIRVYVLNYGEFDCISGTTRPVDLAKTLEIKGSLVVKEDGILRDSWRPLTKDCQLEFLTWESDDGKHVFWHSSAHILGQALERIYNCNLCVGPPIESGESNFYYEAKLPDGIKINEKDFKTIEDEMRLIVKENQEFQRLEIKKVDALEMFKGNPYKVEIIGNKVPEGGTCTVYRCGDLIDLCRGPHLPNTGLVKSFKITGSSSSYFLGDSNRDSLTRIYACAFPNKKLLKEHLRMVEEAKKRDHRELGKKQELFFFDPVSPGSCFFLPHGTRVYRKLQDLILKEYWRRGFEEVMTPCNAKNDLWKTSGHWDKYKDNMFTFKCDLPELTDKEKEEDFVQGDNWAQKCMNCPFHCIMFNHRVRSYRELPIRYADFGVLHRNELAGALTGLTRVRKFSQDDAHIFCSRDQIKEEIEGCLGFLQDIYGIFGFEFSLELSTRPETFIGSEEVWDEAELKLGEALNNYGRAWSLNKGDGAFYGPKIDIHVKDALGRSHQCATIQLDFNLPSEDRFNLKFVDHDGEVKEPVIIHRAIYGSFERFIAILIEHFGGKWPFWISPRQAMVIPISEKFLEYSRQVTRSIRSNGYYVDVDDTDRKINKKIREAQLNQYNYILVIGAREEEKGTVNVRYRDSDNRNEVIVKDLLEEFKTLSNNYK